MLDPIADLEAPTSEESLSGQLWEWTSDLAQSAEVFLGRQGQEGQEALQNLREAMARTGRLIAAQKARIRYLEGLSITDELTGMLNRRGFYLELTRARARATRHGESGLLLLCDLNNFKAVNDNHGHLIGDRVLCAVARLLQSNTRRSDYAARLGGDEFAVLMTDTPRALGEELAGKLEAVVNQHVLIYRDHRVAISASFGYETYDDGGSLEAAFYSADKALYRSKPAREPETLSSP